MAQINEIDPDQTYGRPNNRWSKFSTPKSTTAPTTPTAKNRKNRVLSRGLMNMLVILIQAFDENRG